MNNTRKKVDSGASRILKSQQILQNALGENIKRGREKATNQCLKVEFC